MIHASDALSPGAQAMLEAVCSYRRVSMVELERAYELEAGHGTASGRLAVEVGVPNLWIWAQVSEGFAAAFDELRPLTELEPCHPLVYLLDGAIPRLPIAKRPPANGYRAPHWMPVVVEPGAALSAVRVRELAAAARARRRKACR